MKCAFGRIEIGTMKKKTKTGSSWRTMFFNGLSCEQTYLRDFNLINEMETKQL